MPSVISCPSCQKQLKVPDELIGRNVKCPGCKETFMAQVQSQPAPPAPPPPPQEEIAERPRKKAIPVPEEEEDEAPRKRARRDDDDADVDDRPSRRRRSGGRFQPHRGILILLLGIGSLVVFGPLGPFAWIMGNNDLKEMDAGRMDPEGRQMTQIGKICGIIASILMIVSVLGICLCGFVGILGSMSGPGR